MSHKPGCRSDVIPIKIQRVTFVKIDMMTLKYTWKPTGPGRAGREEEGQAWRASASRRQVGTEPRGPKRCGTGWRTDRQPSETGRRGQTRLGRGGRDSTRQRAEADCTRNPDSAVLRASTFPLWPEAGGWVSVTCSQEPGPLDAPRPLQPRSTPVQLTSLRAEDRKHTRGDGPP